MSPLSLWYPRVVHVAVLSLNSIAFQGQTALADTLNIKQLTAIVHQRQKKFSSAQLTYVTESKVSKFKLLNSEDAAKAMQDPATARRLKSECLTARQEVHVTIGGPRMKYDLHILQALPRNTNQAECLRVQDAFNGKTIQSYADVGSPSGHIRYTNSERCPVEESPSLVPIVWTFGDWEYSMRETTSLRVDAASADTMIDTHPCVVLEYARGGNCLFSVWFDPSEDFVVRRYAMRFHGEVDRQVDCRYDQTAGGCWAPAEWTETAFSEGSPVSVAHSQVTECSINSAPGDDAYNIDFPPGTRVKSFLPGLFEVYTVRPDGSKEIVSQAKGRVDAFQKPIPSRRVYWLSGICLLLIMLCGFFFIRHRKRRRDAWEGNKGWHKGDILVFAQKHNAPFVPHEELEDQVDQD